MALHGHLDEGIRAMFRNKVKQTFDDAANGVVSNPLNEESID